MSDMDEHPLAVRRKRRASTALADPADKENPQQLKEETSIENASPEPPKTPGKRKKRTRFSDSVIEMGAGFTTDLTQAGSSSTGLTPAFNRTILIPVKSMDKVKKRLSLPEQLMTPSSSRSSTGSPLSTSPIEIQFAPLSQKISDRTMRRLKRNHLSETTNEIHEKNKRSKKTLQEEVWGLRAELALIRQPRNGTNAATNTTGAKQDDTGRIEELEVEISNLKQEMQEQSTPMDRSTPEAHQDRSSVSHPLPVEVADSDNIAALQNSVTDLAGAETQSNASRSLSPVSVTDAATQVALPPPGWIEALRTARIEYENLFPGETTIGLELSDPEAFIQTMISRAESLKKETERIEKEFSVKETSRTNMGRNFTNALAQLEHLRTQIQATKAQFDEERNRTRSAELEISTLKAHVENTEAKTSELKQQRDDNQRSVQRLQNALRYYREESEKLTRTVLNMESTHEAHLANLRLQLQASNATALSARDTYHREHVSDLTAEIHSEKLGRLKAEESAVNRLYRIYELENRLVELRATVNQKQAIIRQLEAQIEQNKSEQEKEVGPLNVRIGLLESDLASANAELAKAREESTRLSNLVEEEKAAGLKAVETMQSEMKRCANKGETVKEDHAEGVKKRGEQVAQSFGLITPVVEGGRFRDAEADEKVEGQVELLRGKASKKRPDSGVDLWESAIDEEDEDGDAVMQDSPGATSAGPDDFWERLMT
ncbi:MAG: hypothetical protein Q9221_003930 [Calogaya cf. arnoldii]